MSCAAARAVVDAIDDDLLENVRDRNGQLVEALERIPGVVSVRGRGLLVGIELANPAADVVEAARDHGLLVLTAGETVVRLAPPLTVSEQDAAEALAVLDRILC